MLSHALTTTHDAIIGHWNPKRPLQAAPPAPADLAYLSEARRTQVICAAMSGLFQVSDHGSGKASVLAGGVTICEIARPSNVGTFRSQLELVMNYADLRIDRLAEILAQEADILAFFAAIAPTDSPRRKSSFELLTAAQAICVGLEMQAKHYCWAARPAEFSQDVQPAIPTPDHSTFPSGHATEAFAIATILHRLMTGKDSADGLANWRMVFRLAHRIAVNRTVAGLHFPIDSAAGAVLGCAIGDAFCDLLEDGRVHRRAFDGNAPFGDFQSDWLKRLPAPTEGKQAAEGPPLVKACWSKAKLEWRRK
jgi:PAP2 superfamily